MCLKVSVSDEGLSIQAYLRGIMGSVPDYHRKASCNNFAGEGLTLICKICNICEAQWSEMQ